MEDKNKNVNAAQTESKDNAPMTLADESRVKVMSPSMLVFKRFIRNKLAVIGFIILAVMFLFAFVGPIFSPYKESQRFEYDELTFVKFAEYKMQDDWTCYFEAPDTAFTTSLARRAKSQFKTANPATTMFKLDLTADQTFYATRLGERVYTVSVAQELAQYNKSTSGSFSRITQNPVDDAIYNMMVSALAYKTEATFELNGITYYAVSTPVTNRPDIVATVVLSQLKEECVATSLVFHDATENSASRLSDVEKAAICKQYYALAKTPVGSYTCGIVDATGNMMVSMSSTPVAMVSNYVLNPKNAGEFIPLDIKQAVAAEATQMANGKEDVGDVTVKQQAQAEDTTGSEETAENVNADGTVDITYKIERVLDNYTSSVDTYSISKESFRRMFLVRRAPTSDHILGTDNFGMDVMTRLMYGGRVSLKVGFIVVFIELLIGVVLGGISGYFSGWVDVIIMRIIELFNCIPFYPMLMIIGSVLDARNVGAEARINLLMVLLGLLNWPGIARIVRGQIMSLREQDFIIATEACGIPVSRRIFKHLIPNVIPLLIVNATMSLGGIIITEATLSFLGLGVKYPAASWGSIINQAEDAFIMQTCPWIWIPAGVLILLTVLGFNFVGDGLRDAFDPKMKR